MDIFRKMNSMQTQEDDVVDGEISQLRQRGGYNLLKCVFEGKCIMEFFFGFIKFISICMSLIRDYSLNKIYVDVVNFTLNNF